MVKAAPERGMDGVICGYIHHGVITELGAASYANCGDWVASLRGDG